MAVHELVRDTREKARKEGKTAVVVCRETGKQRTVLAIDAADRWEFALETLAHGILEESFETDPEPGPCLLARLHGLIAQYEKELGVNPRTYRGERNPAEDRTGES